MLRHAIFVLVLVGAAFAGGAVINGPGLAWLQRNLIGGPTIITDGSAPPSGPGRAARRFPSADHPPLPFAIAGQAPVEAPAPPDPADAPTGPGSAPLAASPALPAPAAPAAPATSPADPALLPPLDLPPEPAAATVGATPAPRAAKADPVARLASVGGGPDAGTPTPPSTPARDWVEIRQRLKALGVTRYTVDAEFDGRVRFSCVIPVDGLRAVGHHFEADGDDEWQAVDATMRRIALWRATEPSKIEP